MEKRTAAEHYEQKFEFPLWRMIQDYANEHDCSYSHAADVVMPGYEKQAGIRYRDDEYELSEVHKRQAEQRELSAKIAEENAKKGVKSNYDGLFGTDFNAKFEDAGKEEK